MSRQDIQKEIAHFRNTDWYRLEASDQLDETSLKESVQDLVEKTNLKKHAKVLEIACGGGQFGLTLVKTADVDYTGLDLMPELIADAKKRAIKEKIRANFLVGDAHKLPFEDKSFDLVVITYSLHHFPKESLDQVTNEVHRVLKPGGYYYTLEPNGLNPLVFKWWLLNSPERILPLGKKWRETWDLSVNETIIYPWQITRSLRTRFAKVKVYSIGFTPNNIGFFKKNIRV